MDFLLDIRLVHFGLLHKKPTEAHKPSVLAIGVRLNASKSYLVRSPEAALNDADRRGRTTMSFVALDSEGTLAEQHMTSVSPEEAARYLGVWFSFNGVSGFGEAAAGLGWL